MNRTARYSLSAAVAAAAIALAGSAVPIGTAAASSGGTIRIGFVGPLSGADATFGLQTQDGVKAAVSDINKAGGVDGKKLVVTSLDDKGVSATTRLDFLHLASNGIHFVVSGSTGADTAAAESVMVQNDMITLNPVASNPKLLSADASNAWYFMLQATNPQYGKAIAYYAAKQLKLTKVAVFELNTIYSQQVLQGFKSTLAKHNGSITKTITYTFTQTNFQGQVSAALATHPDTIFLTGFPTTSNLIAKAVRAAGFTGPIIGTIGMWSPTYGKAVGTSGASGTYIDSNFPLATADQTAVGRALAKKLGSSDGVYSAGAWDGVEAVAKAIKSAGSTKPTAVRKALFRTNFVGTAGQVAFAKNGSLRTVEMYFAEFKSGSWVDVTKIPTKKFS